MKKHKNLPNSKYSKSDLVYQKQILNNDFSELLGLYFVCEKLAKRIAPNENKGDLSLKIVTLKNSIKTLNLSINENVVNLIFNTNWNNKTKNQISFRFIRNKVCHECSVSNRDYAVKNKVLYMKSMSEFFDELCKILTK